MPQETAVCSIILCIYLEELEAKHGPLRERAEREAAEGDRRRLNALEELEEVVRRRRERGA
jgi:hypothetical protein